MVHPVIAHVTDNIRARSQATRSKYIVHMQQAAIAAPQRYQLSCSNLAHGQASCILHSDQEDLKHSNKPSIGIITSYNDMLSAHQPYEHFPEVIRNAAREFGGVARVAGGVPAMCDGITQGQVGMELSLFSRDTIALGTLIGLSHNMFDGILCLGICDKIVPGLLIGALHFGHLPVVFVPGGPMPTGISNEEKISMREAYAKGEASEDALLEIEARAYHAPGTCTFYGTANSNQMLMEIMGLQLPGGSFVNPYTDLRTALTIEATRQVIHNTTLAGNYRPLYEIVSEQSIVNGIIGLLTTGGSTNHTIHLVAIAKAAGILINWDDIAALSRIIPLIAKVYPNGTADVNDFHHAGGMGCVIANLLDHDLLHEDVTTIRGKGLRNYCALPSLDDQKNLAFTSHNGKSSNPSIIASIDSPFKPEGGIIVMEGELGRGILKTSAVPDKNLVVDAEARVFLSQEDVLHAFKHGELNRDVIVVLLYQGPRANGMPELHKLTPALSVLQTLGHRVALLTDGRMSGASGKVPSVIHLTPETIDNPLLSRIQDGDRITIDATTRSIVLHVNEETLKQRAAIPSPHPTIHYGVGREAFTFARHLVTSAEDGASFFLSSPIHRSTL